MNNDEAREYFKKLNLSYSKIEPLHIRMLANILEAELITYLVKGGFHAGQMNMKVSTPKVKDMKYFDCELKYCYIKIDGAYFKGREGISFNENGFIGFGGGFSDVNTAPILKAFYKWCDVIARGEANE